MSRLPSLDRWIAALPEFYQERTRNLRPERPLQSGYVLYWMATAQRLAENPALDVAWLLAEELKQPCLIYQGVSQRYRWASDRHHWFLLQSARELQSRAREYGLDYVLEVESGGPERSTNPERSTRLKDLAASAAVVVVEDFPCSPQRDLQRALLRTCDTPVIAVDTACLVPPARCGRAFTRAFEFRNTTKRWYAARVHAEYPQVARRPQQRMPLGLSSNVELDQVRLSDVVASCQIDHSIPPVVQTVGGSSAGYERWQRFVSTGLKQYAWRRNDATLDATSRLSPYLHYGMVSPFRIARQAHQVGGEGAEKFLDELLIWREMAYAFCRFVPHHDRWQALPDWARSTLLAHDNDRRPHCYSWDQLAHAQTHDELWNAAQRSLLCNGELHNNLRMTWGKMVLNWTTSPQRALQWIIDLNHRYALDGRDPSSYGGLLWCLGQFDRPFEPETAVLGTVRPRSTTEHARRLDIPRFEKTWLMNPLTDRPRVAVIGAGISGAMAALTLGRQGYEVKLFDKSRGASGRMATRRWESTSFDHGAQYFTAQDDLFRRYVDAWCEEGLVATWDAPIATYQAGQRGENSERTRYVATPTMNALVKGILDKSPERLTTQYETRIDRLRKTADDWELFGLVKDQSESEPLGTFERVIVTLPAPQAAQLTITFDESEKLSKNDEWTSLQTHLAEQRYYPTWALMVAFDKALPLDWGGAFLNGQVVKWASRTNTKPGRHSMPETLILHAQGEFSLTHLEAAADEITHLMLDDFWAITGLDVQEPMHCAAHRWRYSIPIRSEAPGLLTDSRQQLIFCGDWACGSRVEGAFLSGIAAAGHVMRSVSES